ncbi:MAG: phage tail tape measure protein [Bacteroidales bacterium]|nr:phage tail tape measure protein [Anaerotignum sp.]MCI5680179.1 phage tail tape measure protein [Bacteroidales bacterium]MDY3926870.1 phage tail tape measure protein [Anaerotignum sp.]
MSESKIKGITVEIGGDLNPLEKAIKAANKPINAMQKELKGIETLLKMDPSNVDLLRQKEELLGKSIKETENKLEALKKAKDQADKEMASGTQVNQEEYRNLVREIASTENKLDSLTKSMKDFGSVSAQQIASVGGKMQEVGGKIEDAGKKMLPVTGAATGLAAAAVKTASDFDSSMSQVAAVSGAAGDELDQLREKAREMGSKTKFSASEAADAMNYMAMAGWKTSDMLGGIEGVMSLAAASGEDLAVTSDILTDGLTAFGLSAQESGRMADVMAAAASNANTNVSILGESYKYCASTAGAMGYSLEDVTESLGLMANAGVKGSQAGTTLKNAMINLAKPTDAMAQAMDNYNISITNSDGSMKSWNEVVGNLRESLGGLSESEQTAAVATLFGKEATAGMLSVINAAPEDIAKLNDALTNCGGVAADMANTMQDNLGGQLQTLKSQMEELAISIGEILMPIIRDIVGHIQGFVEKLNGMSDGSKKVIVTIALLVAALGPILVIVGQLITSVGTILTLVPKLVSGFGMVKAAVAAIGGPVTIIIAIITALVMKFIHAYNTSEEFRNKVNGAFQSVKDTVSSVISEVSQKIKEFISIGENIVKGLWEGAMNMKNWLVNKMTGFVDSIKNVFTGKKGFDTHSPSKWAEEVMENVDKGFAKIDPKTSEAVQKAKEYSKAIMDAATSYLDNKKFFGEVTAQEEIAYWSNIVKNQNLAADELLEIDKKIHTAKQSILEEEKRAMEEYEASVKSRAEAIAGFAGLFDSVGEQTKVDGDTLIDNLAGQVELLEQWQDDMQELMDRGIAGSLLEELREQGPQAADEIHALTKLSDDELDKFGELYAQKIKLATETAVNELGGLQLAITPVVDEMAANASYAVNVPDTTEKEKRDRDELYSVISQMFATALLEGLNYIGNSIFDAIPKILDFYIDSVKMAKVTWDAFDGEGNRRNRMFAPSYGEIYNIALRAAKSVKGDGE